MTHSADSIPAPAAKHDEDVLAAYLQTEDFFRVLIHELRNQLAPLSNGLQLLRLRGGDDPALQSAIGIMSRQMKSIGRALDKVAAAQRFRRGDAVVITQRIDLAKIIHGATQGTQDLIQSRNQRLHVSATAAHLYLTGNADDLAVALTALLENAAMFSPVGGEIWLDTGISDNRLSIHVRDKGTGILPEMLPQLFSPPGASARPGGRHGLGLGLMIAHQIVESHGGRLRATSAGPGLGSEFVMQLPLPEIHQDDTDPVAGTAGIAPAHAAAPAPPVPSPRMPSNLQPHRVLIVDDNDAVRISLCTMVEELGHEVKGAADGDEALLVAGEWLPGIVFLDVNLPTLNGYEVAASLRSRFSPQELILVMMSGESLSDTVLRRARKAGFDRCVDKTRTHELLEELLMGDTVPQSASTD